VEIRFFRRAQKGPAPRYLRRGINQDGEKRSSRTNQQLQPFIDEVTNPSEVKVALVEVKEGRGIARDDAPSDGPSGGGGAAPASQVIHARGEYEVAENLGLAAGILEQHPAAMQLRVLGTMTEVTADRSSTVVLPIPVEFLRFFDTRSAGNRA
jgi:hypothetical protein